MRRRGRRWDRASLVERLSQLAARGDVGEDDVAVVAEELVVELGCFANGAGDVKFHSKGASDHYNKYHVCEKFWATGSGTGGKSDDLGDLAVSIHLRIKGFSILVGYS
jgi:hypothetical protein